MWSAFHDHAVGQARRSPQNIMQSPVFANEGHVVLDPDMDERRLKRIYMQIADIMLQLAQCHFPLIGSLGCHTNNNTGGKTDIKVLARPLTLNMFLLGNFARVPHFQLPTPSKTFATSSEFYSALPDMHLQQLSFQRNLACSSADDCRKKYIARQLFRKLAAEGRLADSEFDRGPFRLWCEDFRPGNVLIHEDETIAAVVD
jgi:hypothetical protein